MFLMATDKKKNFLTEAIWSKTPHSSVCNQDWTWDHFQNTLEGMKYTNGVLCNRILKKCVLMTSAGQEGVIKISCFYTKRVPGGKLLKTVLQHNQLLYPHKSRFPIILLKSHLLWKHRCADAEWLIKIMRPDFTIVPQIVVEMLKVPEQSYCKWQIIFSQMFSACLVMTVLIY